MSNELALSPNLQIQHAVARYNMMVEFVSLVMKEGKDFGAVPGTDKPTLLKPGAEKLSSLFELYPVFHLADKVLDWERDLYFYQYECSLINRKSGEIWGTGLGSCNSRESKYQYRKAERTCPKCGKASIIKGKKEYGGGWLCWTKKDGCGAKFPEGDQSIEGQVVGRIINPDIPDLLNTIDKMAQKRALVAAALIACNASEFFTQDVEDMGPGYIGDYVEGEYKTVAQPELEKKPEVTQVVPVNDQPESKPTQPESIGPLFDGIPDELAQYMNVLADDGTPYPMLQLKELTVRYNSLDKALKANGLTDEQRKEKTRKHAAADAIIRYYRAHTNHAA